MVRSGALRHRVQLQNNAGTADSAGQISQSWTTYATVYAEVIYKGGAEVIRGQQVDAKYAAIVRIRFVETGTFPVPEHRVKWDSVILNIDTVERRDTHKRELWLYCTEDV
tara:strand:- start:62 stop:391 length:330 start_codon:yes stop_codon:yes gene_type:complete